jgi:hypothetical protein
VSWTRILQHGMLNEKLRGPARKLLGGRQYFLCGVSRPGTCCVDSQLCVFTHKALKGKKRFA